jgi:hypothetical protein
MDETHYREYLSCQAKGLKREAKTAIGRFIASFVDNAERVEWTQHFLASHRYGDAVRGELYELIIFPVLLEAVRQGSASGYFGMAATHQSLYRAKWLWQKLAGDRWPVELDLLRECKRIDPAYPGVDTALIDSIIKDLRFAVHELPSGLLASPQAIFAWVAEARSFGPSPRQEESLANCERLTRAHLAHHPNGYDEGSRIASEREER